MSGGENSFGHSLGANLETKRILSPKVKPDGSPGIKSDSETSSSSSSALRFREDSG